MPFNVKDMSQNGSRRSTLESSGSIFEIEDL
jgi:hypothetical protein